MHQCLKCKTYFEDDTVPILNGCKCGSRIFLFVKQPTDVERADRMYSQIESKIRELEIEQLAENKLEGQQDLTTSPAEYNKDGKKDKKRYAEARKAVKAEKSKFGVETIRVKDIGIYQINLDALMKGQPIIVLSKGGSYIISLPALFGQESEVTLG